MVRIAVIPGDGVGPQVIREAKKVLLAIEAQSIELRLSMDEFSWGTEHYLESGAMMPADGISTLSSYDAILLGAVGSPLVKDHITLRELLLPIRVHFDQYVNFRPIKLLAGIESPLRNVTPSDIDMLFVREGTEGEYAGIGDRLYPGTDRELALQTAVFSRRGVERVVRWAFELARREDRAITSVSKGNALQYSAVLWDEVFLQIAADYPDVEAKSLLVDAAAMLMVRDPARFGVIVASNLFGDILTDLGAALMGGLGLAPSASLNPDGLFPSMFEPTHGSAPDIRQNGIANPIGAIWSAALMLNHMGYEGWAETTLRAIELSIQSSTARTPDLGGTASTQEVGDVIVKMLDRARHDCRKDTR